MEDIILHQSGRIILYSIGDITFGNIYLPSGTDGGSRASRENFCGEVIPTLLINSKVNGIIGGDWNKIICKEEKTHHRCRKFDLKIGNISIYFVLNHVLNKKLFKYRGYHA